MIRMPLVLLLWLTATLLSCSSAGSTQPTAQDRQMESAQMDMWIRKLRSHDMSERHEAKNEILTSSNKSVDSRKYAIKELLKLAKLQSGCIEVLTSNERFFEWEIAVDILGTLKAAEAIDVLIENLDCSKATTLSPTAYPATKAIMRIGSEAVPKLSEALTRKPVRVRFMAVQALYGIGGDEAKAALSKRAETETDEVVARMIKDALQDWENSGGQNMH